MSSKAAPQGPRRPLPALGSMRRVARLTWVEVRKLVSHRLFPATVIITLVVTAGLGLAARALTAQMGRGGAGGPSGFGSGVSFSNYSLWVATSTYGLQVATILLVALGAMAMSMEATGRTLNTVLARPIRRVEFALAKVLALVFASLVVLIAAALAAYVVGGTVQERHARPFRGLDSPPEPSWTFPSYGDVVDPRYPDTVIATRGEVMSEILYGFCLLAVPVLAAVSLGFLLGTLIDSSGLAVGLSVGVFVTLEATKFIPLLQEQVGRFTFNYPMTRIAALMLDAGKGMVPRWDDAVAGVGVSALYVAVGFLVSVVVFCRRDITL